MVMNIGSSTRLIAILSLSRMSGMRARFSDLLALSNSSRGGKYLTAWDLHTSQRCVSGKLPNPFFSIYLQKDKVVMVCHDFSPRRRVYIRDLNRVAPAK